MEEKGGSTNVTSFVGNGTLREYVIGMEKRKASPGEIKKMQELLDMEMRAGAVGVSSSLLYAPSSSADTEELVALAKVAAQHNGMYISHIRSEDNYLLVAIEELIEIGKTAQLPAEINHLKASGENNWHKMDSAIHLIPRGRPAPVTANPYPGKPGKNGNYVIVSWKTGDRRRK